jgi:hypothetical protein
MKLLLEKWRQVLNEADEQDTSEKGLELQNLAVQIKTLMANVQKLGDVGVKREALESILSQAQEELANLGTSS